jgi:hypothetical protein
VRVWVVVPEGKVCPCALQEQLIEISLGALSGSVAVTVKLTSVELGPFAATVISEGC